MLMNNLNLNIKCHRHFNVFNIYTFIQLLFSNFFKYNLLLRTHNWFFNFVFCGRDFEFWFMKSNDEW